MRSAIPALVLVALLALGLEPLRRQTARSSPREPVRRRLGPPPPPPTSPHDPLAGQ